MTVIAWDGKTLASDKQACSGGAKARVQKIWRTDDGHLVGGTGNAVHVRMVLDWFRAGCVAEDYPKVVTDAYEADKDTCDFFAIGTDGSIRVWGPTHMPMTFEAGQKMAFGSGSEAANAAMVMGADAVRAVEVACEVNVYCGMGVDMLTLNEAEKDIPGRWTKPYVGRLAVVTGVRYGRAEEVRTPDGELCGRMVASVTVEIHGREGLYHASIYVAAAADWSSSEDMAATLCQRVDEWAKDAADGRHGPMPTAQFHLVGGAEVSRD